MIDLNVFVVVKGGRVGLVVDSDVLHHPKGRNFCVEFSLYEYEWHHVSQLTESNFQEFLKNSKETKQSSVQDAEKR